MAALKRLLGVAGPLLAGLAGGACAGRAPRVALPPPAAVDAASAPHWPAEEPRVAWVASVDAPGMTRPMDVACDDDHRLAVADPGAHAVWLAAPDAGRWARRTSANGAPLETPVGVAWDGSGRLLVVDSGRRAVFRGPGRARGRLRPAWRGDPLVRPVAVVPAAAGAPAVVVDSGAHALFELGGRREPPSPLRVRRGATGTGFNFPVDAARGPGGSLLVVDALNAVIDRVSGEGIEVVAGGMGYVGGDLVRPKGIALDPAGRMHVVDAGMQHVQVYGADGAWLGRYGEPGDGPGALSLPAGICIDGHGHVFVADSLNGRVEVFALLDLAGEDGDAR